MSEYVKFDNIDFQNNVFNKINLKLIKELKLIPFNEDHNYLYVLKIQDEVFNNEQALKLIFNKPIKYSIVSLDDYERIINYLGKSSIQGFYENILTKTMFENPISNSVFEEKSEFYNHEIKNNLIVRTIDNIIEKAILLKASDVHFEPAQDFVNVRMRIDGELIKNNELPLDVYTQVSSRIKVLSNLDITKHLKAQDGKITYKYNNENFDIRVSILPTLYGERISLRILDDFSNSFTLNDIYLDDKAKNQLLNILNEQNGLILVVGATGSGKTTTLYSFLKMKNNVNTNIITVEDPIEYSIDGISQVQVDENIGITFTETLRSVLRQDPDVFMIGEIRDEESAEIAIRSATTGHMVFSTLHANDAETSISRLLDMNIPPFLIANSLKAIIYQKLVKKRCSKCLKQEIVDNKIEIINEGCTICNYTGFKGRIAIGEILIIDEQLRKGIISQTYHEVIENYSKSKKYIKYSTMYKRALKEGLVN